VGLGGDKPNPPNSQVQPPPDGSQPADPNKKKGFFGKIADIFKDDKSSNPPKPAPNDNAPNH
jgi:hypothetical protein